MAETTIKLDEQDWAELLKGKSVKVGQKILTVRPYTIAELTKLKLMFVGIQQEMKKEGFTTGEALTSEKGMARLFEYIASNCPVLIEMATGLDREEVPKLPIAAGLTLVAEIINANIESQKGLQEALSYLGKVLAQ